MELIYMDEDFNELGIITDFTIDYAYGKDENNFEIKTPENEMQQGYYWYMPDTDYGGRVDGVKCENSAKEITYIGRTWHGILNSFSGLQITPIYNQNDISITFNNEYINLSGDVTKILNYIINDLQLDINVSEDSIEQDISLSVSANQKIYDLLVNVCNEIKCKLMIEYDNGLEISIAGAEDYTQDSYFDSSQYSVSYQSEDRVPNHLIGYYKKDTGELITFHLYTDENGNVQPYYSLDEFTFDYTMDGVHYSFNLNHDKPLYNEEYLRGTGTKQVEGLDEIVEVVEGGSTVENYDMVTPKTELSPSYPYGTKGNTEFVQGVPEDWSEKYYTDYYKKEYDDNAQPKYELIPKVIIYNPINPAQISNWTYVWGKYFKRSESVDPETGEYTYTQLTDDDITDNVSYFPVTPNPKTWGKDYATYFWREYKNNKWQYHEVEGIAYNDPKKQNKKPIPDDWKNGHKEDYYFYWQHYKWLVHRKILNGNNKWVDYPFKSDELNSNNVRAKGKNNSYIYVRGSLKNHKPSMSNKNLWQLLNSKYEYITSNFSSNKTVLANPRVKYIVHPRKVDGKAEYISVSDYCNRTKTKLRDIDWSDHTYYINETKYKAPPINRYPEGDHNYYHQAHSYNAPDTSKTYYEQVVGVEPFKKGLYYKKVTDDYSNLIEAMLKKLDDYKEKAGKVEPRIDTDIQQFDVGDIIGGVHPVTQEVLISRVIKKIVRGNSFGINVEYEIG